ncbi:MAG: hypothetical protein ABJO75_00445 [Sedimentitalea sp.]
MSINQHIRLLLIMGAMSVIKVEIKEAHTRARGLAVCWRERHAWLLQTH